MNVEEGKRSELQLRRLEERFAHNCDDRRLIDVQFRAEPV
jgi:hypothetical protein